MKNTVIWNYNGRNSPWFLVSLGSPQVRWILKGLLLAILNPWTCFFAQLRSLTAELGVASGNAIFLLRFWFLCSTPKSSVPPSLLVNLKIKTQKGELVLVLISPEVLKLFFAIQYLSLSTIPFYVGWAHLACPSSRSKIFCLKRKVSACHVSTKGSSQKKKIQVDTSQILLLLNSYTSINKCFTTLNFHQKIPSWKLSIRLKGWGTRTHKCLESTQKGAKSSIFFEAEKVLGLKITFCFSVDSLFLQRSLYISHTNAKKRVLRRNKLKSFVPIYMAFSFRKFIKLAVYFWILTHKR